MKEKFIKGIKWFFRSFIWLGIIILVLDIVTKNVIVANGAYILSKGGIDLIPGFLRINYTINENVAFSISLGSATANRIVFSCVALVVVSGIIIFLVKKWGKIKKIYLAVAMMVIAGALGNVIDRLFYSAEYLNYFGKSGVVDWIDFYGVWRFNFNVADISIVVAAFILIITMIVEEIMDYRKKKATEPKEPKGKVEKVVSASEKEKQKLLEENKDKNE